MSKGGYLGYDHYLFMTRQWKMSPMHLTYANHTIEQTRQQTAVDKTYQGSQIVNYKTVTQFNYIEL